MALTSGSRGNLAYVIFELKFVYPKAERPPTAAPTPGRPANLPVALLLLYVGLFVFCCCSFRFVSFRIVCLFVYLLAYSPTLQHTTITCVSVCVAVAGVRVHIVWNSLLPLHLAFCARNTGHIHSTWPTWKIFALLFVGNSRSTTCPPRPTSIRPSQIWMPIEYLPTNDLEICIFDFCVAFVWINLAKCIHS